MFDTPQLFVLSSLSIAILGIIFLSSSNTKVKVPKVGYSWYTSLKSKRPFHGNIRDVLIEGCKLFPGGFFNIKLFPFGTVTVVNDKKLIEELANAPDTSLDFYAVVDFTLQSDYTVPPKVFVNKAHVHTIRSTLTKNIDTIFGDMMDEMKHSFEDVLALDGTEWKSVPAHATVAEIITKTTNRIIVGLPYCRDKEYCDMNIKFGIDIFTSATKINMFPRFLHPIIGPLFSKASSYQSRMQRIMGPEISLRLEMLDKFGPQWLDKPDDYLSWVMDEDHEYIRDPEYLSLRMLQVNFAAIHNPSLVFTHAIFNLAWKPSYALELLDEASKVITQHGWTKASMQLLQKHDSFLKESARMNSVSLLGLVREAKENYTFSNGLYIPKGRFVAAPIYPLHYSDEIYKDAGEFKPWRFIDGRDAKKGFSDSNEGSGTQQYNGASSEFLSFGYGRHACPGRFFVTNELKAMLAYIVLNFDVQLENGSTERPGNTYIASTVLPDMSAKVMFRKRT